MKLEFSTTIHELPVRSCDYVTNNKEIGTLYKTWLFKSAVVPVYRTYLHIKRKLHIAHITV